MKTNVIHFSLKNTNETDFMRTLRGLAKFEAERIGKSMKDVHISRYSKKTGFSDKKDFFGQIEITVEDIMFQPERWL